MNKKLAIVSVIVLSIAGSIAFLMNSSNDAVKSQNVATQSESAMSQAPSSSTVEPSPAQQAEPVPGADMPGTYKDYNPTVIADTTGTKLLFFHATWCVQCRALETDIKQKGVPTGVAIIKIDYDSNQNLRQKYGVTLQTTIVRVDDQGNLIKKYVAYEEPTIEALKRNLL